MIGKIIVVLVLYAYPFYCILREMYKLHKNNTIDEDKKNSLFSILFYLMVMHLVLLFWLYHRKGYLEGFGFQKIESDFIILTLSTSQITTSVTRYIRKKRTGESMKLSYTREFKRNINFEFSSQNSFDVIIKKFIHEQKQKGVEVEVISDTSLDLEHLKYLKKGEICIFSENTWLEKVSDKIEHNYYYHNKTLIIFDMHFHLKLAEILTAIDYDIRLFLKFENNSELTKIIIPKGESYKIPKTVMHAAIFADVGKIGLKWE